MTADVIPFRIERQDDGELRISDSEMADCLGYPLVADFRHLIRNHEKILKQFNHLAFSSIARPQGGGRPAREFWLTEAQAIYIVTKSEAPRAVEITVAIVKAFVAFRRSQINPKLYGAVGMELLGFSPRAWGREYSEEFFVHLHRTAGWQRPDGNNHSNCAHFINRYVYEFLFGELGLAALKEANPTDEGQRAYKHHQMLKEKHMPRLRRHIEVVTALLTIAVSLDMFTDNFYRVFPKPNTQVGFLFGEMPGGAA